MHRTRNGDLGWVNMRAYNFFIGGPKFTKFSFIQLRGDFA